MARQYKNFKKFFEGSTLTFIPDLEDYLKNKRVIFRCAHGHMNDLNPDSFKNKRARLEGEPIEKLCIRCENDQDNKDVEKFEEWKARILKNSGHLLLEIGRDRSCVYECGNCKTKTKSFLGNIDNSVGFCPSCQNKQFIKDREEAEKETSELSGYKIVEYIDSHNIKFQCLNGHEYMGPLKDLRRGRRCPECAPERRIETVMEKYGAKYFINTDTFRRHMLEVYGVEHAMHSSKLFWKSVRSRFCVKEIVLPKTRRVLHVMGYEGVAIKRLLRADRKKLINEDDIVVGEEVPTFKYVDDEKKNHVYYPDIHIRNTKIIYEIKSMYVFNLEPRQNYLKFMQVANDGYILIVLIYSSEKNLFDVWTFKPNKPPTSRLGKKLKWKIEFDKPLYIKKARIIFEDSDGDTEDKTESIDNIIPDKMPGDLLKVMIEEISEKYD